MEDLKTQTTKQWIEAWQRESESLETIKLKE